MASTGLAGLATCRGDAHGRSQYPLFVGPHAAQHRVSRYRVGVPVHDDRMLFEFIMLEGAQAGLSWETI